MAKSKIITVIALTPHCVRAGVSLGIFVCTLYLYAALESARAIMYVCVSLQLKRKVIMWFSSTNINYVFVECEWKRKWITEKSSNPKKEQQKFSIVVAPETKEIQKILAQMSNAYRIRDSKTNNGSKTATEPPTQPQSSSSSSSAAVSTVQNNRSECVCVCKRKLEIERERTSRSGSLLQYNYRKSCLLSVI